MFSTNYVDIGKCAMSGSGFEIFFAFSTVVSSKAFIWRIHLYSHLYFYCVNWIKKSLFPLLRIHLGQLHLGWLDLRHQIRGLYRTT